MRYCSHAPTIIKDADVIMGKTLQFVARHLLVYESRRGNLARYEWQRLARDDIGACEIYFPQYLSNSIIAQKGFVVVEEVY